MQSGALVFPVCLQGRQLNQTSLHMLQDDFSRGFWLNPNSPAAEAQMWKNFAVSGKT